MLEELRWRTSVSASALHAAACREAEIPAAHATRAAKLDPAADALLREIVAAGWPAAGVLAELTALAAEIDGNRELVNRVIARRRLTSPNLTAPALVAGAVSDLEAALARTEPNLTEELTLRMRPIREQWEARGPGMLQEVARLTDDAIIPAAAEIVLVAPYAGGHGTAHAPTNRVVFEAVLANPRAELPEAVRLAWLVSQLNADLPVFSDALPGRRKAAAAAAAAVAPVLAAAEAVELARCDEAMIATAIDAWHMGALPRNAASRIWSWWLAWLDHPTRWPVAVAALDQMLR